MTETLTRSRELAPEDQSGASSDDHLISIWLDRFAANTRRGYTAELVWWRARLGTLTLGEIRLADLRAALADVGGAAPATIARRIAAIRSLLRFARRLGYVKFDVGAALELPKARDELAERILEPDEVVRLLAAAGDAPRAGARDHALVRCLYVSGARVSELAALDWEHVHPKDGGAVLTLYGKRGRTRHVWITQGTWAELATLATGIPATGPVFRASGSGRGGRRLSVRDIQRVVTRAARRAGLRGAVSPHWLRHAHATHALERGAPVHVVAACLGHSSVATTTRYLHARPGTGSAEWLGL